MPYIIPENDVRVTWGKWLSTLWFADVEQVRFGGCAKVLCPAWRLAGDVTIHYSAVISRRMDKKDKTVVERTEQKGSLRVNDYVSIFSALDVSVPFFDLMKICVFTDQMPDKSSPSFLQWLMGRRAEAKDMADFPVPDGTLLDRDPDWYSAWQDRTRDLSTEPIFTQAIRNAINSQQSGPNLNDIKIDSITLVGFHSLVLTPLRIPMYLCHYIHNSREKPYHFVMSGQNGEIHDGTDRPLTTFGSFMKGIFGGAFSK